MIDDIGYVNPMCSPPEGDGKKTPTQTNNPDPTAKMTDAQKRLYERSGVVTNPHA